MGGMRWAPPTEASEMPGLLARKQAGAENDTLNIFLRYPRCIGGLLQTIMCILKPSPGGCKRKKIRSSGLNETLCPNKKQNKEANCIYNEKKERGREAKGREGG